MNPVIIIDDVFAKNELEEFEHFSEGVISQGEWFKWCKNGNSTPTLLWILVNKVSSYYDIQRLIGLEVWPHNNTQPSAEKDGGWHYDRDEYRHRVNKILSFPVCSLIFYLRAENLYGGKLVFEDITVTPKRNRLVIFGPGKKHKVENYAGNRFSININPWNRKLEEYCRK